MAESRRAERRPGSFATVEHAGRLQLAFSVVLLTAAGLASRSASVMTVDLGFESRNLLVVRISTAGSARTREAHLA